MWPVIYTIPLIGWNYSIQTGENISTNKSTQIYSRSHDLFPGLYLNLTDDRDPKVIDFNQYFRMKHKLKSLPFKKEVYFFSSPSLSMS